MERIVDIRYIITCDDVYCEGVNCDDCPLFKYSRSHGTSEGSMETAKIPENEMLQFIRGFDSISFVLKGE